MRFVLVYFFIVSLGVSTYSQDMVTDRPDYTESALSILPGYIQIESGIEYSEIGDFNEVSYPNLLTRIGIIKDFEIRIGLSGWSTISMNDNSNTYLNDILLEAKYQLTKSNAKIPMAILFVSTLPTGDEEVKAESVEFGLKFAASRDLSDRVGLGVNVGVISSEINDERKLSALASISAGISVSDRIGFFVETFAEGRQDDIWQPYLDGGFTFLATPEAQLDFYVGTGLNDYASDLIIGGGVSILIGL